MILPVLSLVVLFRARAIIIVIPILVRETEIAIQSNMHNLPEFVVHTSELSGSEAFDHKYCDELKE